MKTRLYRFLFTKCVLFGLIDFPFDILVYCGKFTFIGQCADNSFFQINKSKGNKTFAKILKKIYVNIMFEFYSYSFSRLKRLTLNYPNKEKSRKRKKI